MNDLADPRFEAQRLVPAGAGAARLAPARSPSIALVRLVSCVMAWALFLVVWSSVQAAEPATAVPLRVVTYATAPFVLPRTDPPTGFSVDLWNEVARRMHVEFTWQIVRDPARALDAVQSHDAEVALGAIAITPKSEQTVDFSVPVFDSGLRIMVAARHEAGFVSTLKSMPSAWSSIDPTTAPQAAPTVR